MTTIAEALPVVTGGVDTHLDVHVAAVVTAVGGVLGTEQFPTTAAGYRQLLGWMRTFGQLDRVGVEGTGTYGVALARHLRAEQVTVVEVMRPNRQVRRRHGKTDIVDAIAAARAVLSGEANATPKTHDGPVEALRTLKVLQRSATKARTQALNQLRALLVTASDELRTRLRDLSLGTPCATAGRSSTWSRLVLGTGTGTSCRCGRTNATRYVWVVAGGRACSHRGAGSARCRRRGDYPRRLRRSALGSRGRRRRLDRREHFDHPVAVLGAARH